MKSGKIPWWPALLIYIVTAIITLILARPQAPGMPESLSSIHDLEKQLIAMTDHGVPPGLSLAVVKDGKLVYSNGFGWADYPEQLPADPETVYHWWSITKIVTATAIMQLQEQDALRLDDAVTRYLDFFDVTYPSADSDTITIRRLLNHSSGLPEPGLKVMYWTHTEQEPPVNQTQFLKSVLPAYSTLVFEPGAYTSYSNINYMVLGAIIEKVSGQSYENYIREHILSPLHMDHTDFVYTPVMAEDEAAGSHPLFDKMSPLVPFIAGKFYRGIHGDHYWFKHIYTKQTPPSGLIGPVTDAASFMIAFLNNGGSDSLRILSPKSVQSMLHDSYMKAEHDDPAVFRRQGLGWQIYDHNGRFMIRHEGGGVGFSTIMQLYPDENMGLVLFTNDFTCPCRKIMNLASVLDW